MTITAQFISSLGLSLAELIDMVVGQANRLMEFITRCEALQAELVQKNRQIIQLEEQLQQAQRRACRQAAPFRVAQEHRQPNPGRPGRAKGHRGHYRAKPTRIDLPIEVPLQACPHCQGPVSEVREVQQYIQEIPPVQPLNIQLSTQEGYCPCCDRSVRSTHEWQVSLAEGAARVQLGPNALAIAIDLNKVKGLSLRKTCAVLPERFGLSLSPGGLSLAMARVAQRLDGSYQELIQKLRASCGNKTDKGRGLGRFYVPWLPPPPRISNPFLKSSTARSGYRPSSGP